MERKKHEVHILKNNSLSIRKNFIYNTIYQIFIFITPLLTAPYTARVLGVQGIGLQSFVGSIASYFTMFAALGTSSYGQREIARCKDEDDNRSKTFWEIMIVKGITVGITLLVWIFVVAYSKEYSLFFAVHTITIAASFFDISWYFSGIENFRTIVVKNIVIRLLSIVCLFTLIHSAEDLLLYIAILASSSFLGNISMWFSLNGNVKRTRIHPVDLKRHFKETIVYFIPTIAVSVYTILDKTMLGLLTDGTYENGYYEQAHKLVDMTKAIVVSLNTVMYSRMSYLFKKGKTGEMKKHLGQSIDIIILLSMPMIMGVMGVAKTLVPLFFGENYDKVVDLLYLCMPLVLIIGLSNCLGQQYLTPSGQRKQSNRCVILGATINFAINCLLIPKFGSYGAAISSLIAEITILILYIFMSRTQLNIREVIKNNAVRVVSALIMFAIVYTMNYFKMNDSIKLALQITVGAGAYFLFLALFRDKLFFEAINQYRLKRKKQ